MTTLANATESEVRLRFFCLDCKTDTHRDGIAEFYVVHDWIWKQAVGDTGAGMLCVGCLEIRLGRKLGSGDFKDCPANIDMRSSRRLIHRRTSEMPDVQRALRTLIKALDTDDPHSELILQEVRRHA